MRKDETVYSDMIEGDKTNHEMPVRFDLSGCGYVRVVQYDGEMVKDVVLMTPKQFNELVKFVRGVSLVMPF